MHHRRISRLGFGEVLKGRRYVLEDRVLVAIASPQDSFDVAQLCSRCIYVQHVLDARRWQVLRPTLHKQVMQNGGALPGVDGDFH